MKGLTAKAGIEIDAPLSRVWQALTDPAMIKQYLFGTDTITDWKKGSSITYKGEWAGKPYEDKGAIIDIIPEKLLHTTYWSSMGGKEDKPENYNDVIYEIKPDGDKTIVTIVQDNIDDHAGVKRMEENWSLVLRGMKKLLEGKEDNF
ncbi:MAG: SRPBCC domain-containing protein [Bacteroidetes bacterium]|nr:SRPBCC domain-containing protein [Bacteroidota bacterium]